MSDQTNGNAPDAPESPKGPRVIVQFNTPDSSMFGLLIDSEVHPTQLAGLAKHLEIMAHAMMAPGAIQCVVKLQEQQSRIVVPTGGITH